MRSAASPATDRGEETRHRILEAASRAFAERGYAGTSFADLMAATGLTKGALYFHFPSKDALAMAAFGHAQEKWVAAVLAASDPQAPAADQLEAMLRAAVRFHETEPDARCVARLCFELGEQPEHRPYLVPYLSTWEEMVSALIRRAQDEGDYRPDVDPGAAARVAVAAFIGMTDVSQVVSEGSDLRERASEFHDVFVGGLRRDA
ncbi:MAG TPA: TetR/AcrR family transcriptional regulator [Actinomycetota bacterium]